MVEIGLVDKIDQIKR